MSNPKPGEPVRGSTSGRPLMAALDLFGRRWSLRIVWELRSGPLGFRPLQKQCDDMSSSVMRQRLSELMDAHVVRQLPDSRYELTVLGRDACLALDPLARWSQRWAAELEPELARQPDDQAATRPTRATRARTVGEGAVEGGSAD
ncbi:winged helix-turn-helix transcriptional regulator [Kitasatospora sp. NPDC048194]|uniref:winged helix-turn-helix transcriptional regulator n=1 Tax=Kitasatospora sp. NPDC048194 TaxID=3364045 RepID=UPI003711FC2F